MIVFELICANQHRFEGWFSSQDDFSVQRANGQLECPLCSDRTIEKLLTAKIGHSVDHQQGVGTDKLVQHSSLPVASGAEMQKKLTELIDYVLKNSVDVGAAFPEEARKMHRNEAPPREIRGSASIEEARELLEEGVPIMPLPIPPKSDWH